MPAWSPEIANQFIRLARQDGRVFTQGQLQKLVYIAHGWCLASTGKPLTGDRPEAWEHGPVYRRLADVLAPYGLDPVSAEQQLEGSLCLGLEPAEQALVDHIYNEFGDFESSSLAALTRREGAPWKRVFNGGAGKNREIAHQLVREQFLGLAAHSAAAG